MNTDSFKLQCMPAPVSFHSKHSGCLLGGNLARLYYRCCLSLTATVRWPEQSVWLHCRAHGAFVWTSGIIGAEGTHMSLCSFSLSINQSACLAHTWPVTEVAHHSLTQLVVLAIFSNVPQLCWCCWSSVLFGCYGSNYTAERFERCYTWYCYFW